MIPFTLNVPRPHPLLLCNVVWADIPTSLYSRVMSGSTYHGVNNGSISASLCMYDQWSKDNTATIICTGLRITALIPVYTHVLGVSMFGYISWIMSTTQSLLRV